MRLLLARSCSASPPGNAATGHVVRAPGWESRSPAADNRNLAPVLFVTLLSPPGGLVVSGFDGMERTVVGCCAKPAIARDRRGRSDAGLEGKALESPAAGPDSMVGALAGADRDMACPIDRGSSRHLGGS